MRITVSQSIGASPKAVFMTVADVNQYARAVPSIVKTEFLSPVMAGVGTRYRSVRKMKQKQQATDLEITELVENDHVRIVSKSHGTVWDSVYAVKPAGTRTVLTLTMDAQTNSMPKKILFRLMRGTMQKAMAQDLEGVKAFCEVGSH